MRHLRPFNPNRLRGRTVAHIKFFKGIWHLVSGVGTWDGFGRGTPAITKRSNTFQQEGRHLIATGRNLTIRCSVFVSERDVPQLQGRQLSNWGRQLSVKGDTYQQNG